jgi:citrate synthase
LIRIVNVKSAKTWMTSAEALRTLEVRPQTLYANVSRGKIRARPDAGDPRRSLYHREDVLRMAARANGRRKVETVAAQAIDWGDPVLPSAVSTVIDGRLCYRGLDAIDLAQTWSFERVASLLWEASDDVFARAATAEAAPENPSSGGASALARGLAAMALRGGVDLPTQGRPLDDLRIEAAAVHAALVQAALGPGAPPGRGVAARLARAWGRPEAEDLLRRALILLADHELNASTFATRVAISTGASLSAGVLAGLAALSGPLHGGSHAPLRALLKDAARDGVPAALRAHDDRPAPLPGFGHPLYPDGDPRAAALIAACPLPALHADIAARVDAERGERPNVDYALIALADTFGLPPEAPFVVFMLARCAGWLAHALEQAGSRRLIRPRARYVGIAPAPRTAEAAQADVDKPCTIGTTGTSVDLTMGTVDD